MKFTVNLNHKSFWAASAMILAVSVHADERILPQGANVAPNGYRRDVPSKCLRLDPVFVGKNETRRGRFIFHNDYAAAEYEVPLTPGDIVLEIEYEGDMARLYADGVLVQDDFWKGLPIRYALRRLPKGTKRLVLKVLPRGAGWEEKIYIDAWGLSCRR